VEGRLPIFGDNFTGRASDQSLILHEGVEYIKTSVMDDCEFLDLSESDAIYGSTFAMIIKEAFRADSNAIIAKVRSRGQDKFNESSSDLLLFVKQEGTVVDNYFNAFSSLKLLF